MDAQLQLTEEPADWRLDEEIRSVGRQGLRAAREVLRAAPRAGRPHDTARAA